MRRKKSEASEESSETVFWSVVNSTWRGVTYIIIDREYSAALTPGYEFPAEMLKLSLALELQCAIVEAEGAGCPYPL